MMKEETIIIVSSLITRDVNIDINGVLYDIEIDIDIPFEEISLNAYKQLVTQSKSSKKVDK